MPTQSYRFYDVDPAYQATLQSSIHNFRLTHQTNPTRHPHERSDHYEQTNADAKAHNQEHGHAPWSQSAERTDFENAARTGCDMSHVISHRSWVQCDWSNRTPICPTGTLVAQPITPEPYTRQANIYVLDGSNGIWSHRGAGTLTLHQSPPAPNGAHRQPWVSVHTYGSGRLEGSFSLFPGIEIIRFNDAVLCTTIQAQDQYNPSISSVSNTRFVTYAFQTELIDQASEIRQQLAMAARPSESAAGSAAIPISKPRVDIDGGMEKRLTSWINVLEAKRAPLMQMQQSSLSFDGQWSHNAYNTPDQSNSAIRFNISNGFDGFNGPNASTVPQPRGLRRRGGVDLGNACWDLEKSRALREAKDDLDSLQLKRLFSGFELAT